MDSGITADELTEYLQPLPPEPKPDLQELKDVRWFHKDWINAQINDRKHHLLPYPQLSNFTTPGRYALARRILHEITDKKDEWKGDQIPDVDIDIGRFKYVLVRVSDSNGHSKIVVKGSKKATYHMDAFQDVKASCVARGLQAEVLGGGRMEHYPEQQIIQIYGYSSAFGPAVHEVSSSIISRWFPFYKFQDINVSYEGY
eukprot:TRINITY_DN30912_c2_g1_i1.p2 TRINITY_DN30912_c2_g1~~TRINITY_DN30912_c2_g1_i1.p2  ORF type:complete len:200 (-),score=24.32 TRINITY_DN30912_c2_g1_i1:147-746(-)